MSDLDKFIKLLGTTDGRDKIYKFVAGVTKILAYRATDKNLAKKYNTLAKSIGEGRSLMRMAKWVGNYNKLQGFAAKAATLTSKQIVEIIRVIGDFGYILGDNLAYLSKYGVLPLNAESCGKNSKVFQFWGYLCAVVLDIWGLLTLEKKKFDDEKQRVAERQALLLALTKDTADLFAVLAAVGYAKNFGYNPSSGFTGFCGATSGAVATYINWAKIK